MKRLIGRNNTELQQIIAYLDLNAQTGEMARAIYRKGRASHSDELRDAKKVLFYAQAEVARLERLKAGSALAEAFGQQNQLTDGKFKSGGFTGKGCAVMSANAGPMLRCPDCIAEHCACIAS